MLINIKKRKISDNVIIFEDHFGNIKLYISRLTATLKCVPLVGLARLRAQTSS